MRLMDNRFVSYDENCRRIIESGASREEQLRFIRGLINYSSTRSNYDLDIRRQADSVRAI